MSRSKGRLTLPANPNLEFLRNQAKERLAIIRSHAPEAQLSDAQFALARDYGFSSWRELNAQIQHQADSFSAFTGFYRYDPGLIANMAFEVTVRDGRLVVGRSNAARFEVTPQGEDVFLSPGLSTVYRFEKDADGEVVAMLVETEGRVQRAVRIDAATMRQLTEDHARALKEEGRQRFPIAVTADMLQPYVGHYASAFGSAMEITRQDDRLFVQAAGQSRIPLSAETLTDFFIPGAPAWMHFCVDDGAVTGLQHHQGGTTVWMQRVSAEDAAKASAAAMRRLAEQLQPRHIAAIDVALLPRFAGRYRVDAAREMVVNVEGRHLFAQITNQPRFEIYPEASNKFFLTAVAAQIEFFFDHAGQVSHAVLHQAGRVMPLGRIEEAATV